MALFANFVFKSSRKTNKNAQLRLENQDGNVLVNSLAIVHLRQQTPRKDTPPQIQTNSLFVSTNEIPQEVLSHWRDTFIPMPINIKIIPCRIIIIFFFARRMEFHRNHMKRQFGYFCLIIFPSSVCFLFVFSNETKQSNRIEKKIKRTKKEEIRRKKKGEEEKTNETSK